ncbi:copper homeostasis protein CutC [Agrobacterium sp. ES01]|uniref:copper homeostasis protein CutC n=1 Tax=Agrobacterium sp. ES01 TaxID=3420714 RepID=UPI003D14D788
MTRQTNPTTQTPLLEVCVDNAEGLDAAIAGGAGRIELCSALALGGLTPSMGLMALAAKAPVPVHALIRPRAGDFAFSISELAVMRTDIDAARTAGLAGVVIGASTRNGALDEGALTALVQTAEGMDLTLHRAFDLTPDPFQAMELAISLGFKRILTSGCERTAIEGKKLLSELNGMSRGRISIMPGSGIRADNAATLLKGLSVSEVHASCSVPIAHAHSKLVNMGFVSTHERQTDAHAVAALKSVLAAC